MFHQGTCSIFCFFPQSVQALLYTRLQALALRLSGSAGSWYDSEFREVGMGVGCGVVGVVDEGVSSKIFSVTALLVINQ